MQTITLFKTKTECCGCEACVNSCPRKAITMREDENGFRYPVIDEALCVKCGLCKRTCAYQNHKEMQFPLETYVACTANTDVMKSASGGIFASLAKNVIEQGGVVFGVSMECVEGDLVPMHICVDNLVDLVKLQGSKYVQSVVGDAYLQVKKALAAGKKVLFSGTPCQVAALKSFLGTQVNENLLLVDIICHGVPSLHFFRSYIQYYEGKIKGKIVDFKFRDKSGGWGLVGRAEYIKNGKRKSRLVYARESSYYQLFLKGDIYRENCYECKYACENRPGDITLGDYWGIEREHPELLKANGGCFDEAKGVSCMIVNSEKGKRYLEENVEIMTKRESAYEKASAQNGQLKFPTPRSERRDEVLRIYREHGYKGIEKRFLKSSGIKLLVAYVVDRVPVSVKKRIRRLMK